MTLAPSGSPAEPWSVTEEVIAIAGMGVTGQAVTSVLLDRGARVFGLDATADPSQQPLSSLIARGLELTTADLDLTDASQWLQQRKITCLIASPGWPPTAGLLAAAQLLEIPIWSEAELAWRLRSRRGPTWLVVTGTNGKTTTVRMLEAMLRAGGKRARAVGNIGQPLITAALDNSYQYLAVELSSFQLHYTDSMAPRAAALLNIAPDHLDWHGGYANYRAAKLGVFARATHLRAYNAQDADAEVIQRATDHPHGVNSVGISLSPPLPGNMGVIDDHLCDWAFTSPFENTAQEVAALSDLDPAMNGPQSVPAHLVIDALFAAALARSVDIAPAEIAAGLRNYSAYDGAHAHRGELVAIQNEVTFVNNSKATNPHAAQAAFIGQSSQSVVWILGGETKGADFTNLIESVRSKLRAVVLIGRRRDQLRQLLGRHAPHLPVIEITARQNRQVPAVDVEANGIMEQAVGVAARYAQPGDTVLLAPACASHDQFTSYEHRGQAFIAAVTNLEKRQRR